MTNWFSQYVAAQKAALDTIPLDKVEHLVEVLKTALAHDRQIFVIGNGGSAANASHFVTDLGKGASDKLPKRFRVLSLCDNASWITAIGNDYSYDHIFLRQLENHARNGDVLLSMTVSGNSPNIVKALEWSKQNGLVTIALVGGKKGRMAEIADHVLVVNDTHYGRVEDAHMGICHMLAYAFMENTPLAT